jgi:hypothetical protein
MYLVLEIRHGNNILPFEIHMHVVSLIIKKSDVLFPIDFLCDLVLITSVIEPASMAGVNNSKPCVLLLLCYNILHSQP